VFAIDWIRERDGSYFTSDGTKLTDWPGYGAPIHAVAGGTVVKMANNQRQVPPNVPIGGNPDIHRPDDFVGNNVIEKIAAGEYAVYAHLQTGSVRVKVGERLRTGEVIGQLGNSGNTTAPHLHFGIEQSPNNLASNSLPFEIRSFTRVGTIRAGSKPGTLTVSGRRLAVTRSEPLLGDLIDFPG
jgi:murein DD-endopeptidase MepM/ murein hydrolase activator NlpD